MIHRRKAVEVTCSVYNFVDPRIAELNNLPRFKVNKVIVLAALISTFKLGNIFTKLMLDHKITIEKQFYCIVKRCSAHTVVLVFHENIQRFNVKMTAPGVYFVQNCISLRSLSVSPFFEVFCKYLFNSRPGIIVNHIWSDLK
jgi:hypothetical protein